VELRDSGGSNSVTVSKIVLQGGSGETTVPGSAVKCGPDNKSLFITVPDIRPSPNLKMLVYLSSEGGTDSNGEFWVRKIVSLDAASTYSPGARVASWTPDKLVGDSDVLARIDLPDGAISKPGTYHVKFQYTHGGCAADFKEVNLLANSTVVASDPHDGSSGNSSDKNDYLLTLREAPPAARFSIQFKIKGRGGADSYGDIRLTQP
jgi:hypothetical protein